MDKDLRHGGTRKTKKSRSKTKSHRSAENTKKKVPEPEEDITLHHSQRDAVEKLILGWEKAFLDDKFKTFSSQKKRHVSDTRAGPFTLCPFFHTSSTSNPVLLCPASAVKPLPPRPAKPSGTTTKLEQKATATKLEQKATTTKLEQKATATKLEQKATATKLEQKVKANTKKAVTRVEGKNLWRPKELFVFNHSLTGAEYLQDYRDNNMYSRYRLSKIDRRALSSSLRNPPTRDVRSSTETDLLQQLAGVGNINEAAFAEFVDRNEEMFRSKDLKSRKLLQPQEIAQPTPLTRKKLPSRGSSGIKSGRPKPVPIAAIEADVMNTFLRVSPMTFSTPQLVQKRVRPSEANKLGNQQSGGRTRPVQVSYASVPAHWTPQPDWQLGNLSCSMTPTVRIFPPFSSSVSSLRNKTTDRLQKFKYF